MKTVKKPWGSYKVYDEGKGWQLKQLVVKPGERTSLQSHKHRQERWILVEGTATVFQHGQTKQYKAPHTLWIPIESKHQVLNEGKEDVVIVEVWLGNKLSEDDITRYEDKYGRDTV